MNRTAVALSIFGLGALGMLGGIVLFIFRPEQTAAGIAFITSTLGTFLAVGATLLQLSDIKKQTNGINSILLSKATQTHIGTVEDAKASGVAPSPEAIAAVAATVNPNGVPEAPSVD